MLDSLCPCPSCQRHVYLGEKTCPFCDAELSGAAASAEDGAASDASGPGACKYPCSPPDAHLGSPRLGRAALLAASALTAASCGQAQPVYGAPGGGSTPTNPEGGIEVGSGGSGEGTGGTGSAPVYGAPAGGSGPVGGAGGLGGGSSAD